MHSSTSQYLITTATDYRSSSIYYSYCYYYSVAALDHDLSKYHLEHIAVLPQGVVNALELLSQRRLELEVEVEGLPRGGVVVPR